MPFHSGLEQLDEMIKIPIISSGNATLDRLLYGGFRKDFIYLLYGNRKIIKSILIKTVVLLFKKDDFTKKVAFVDGNKRFNPYKISKFAVSQNLSPKQILDNILITRTFTYDQMIELLENHIAKLEKIFPKDRFYYAQSYLEIEDLEDRCFYFLESFSCLVLWSYFTFSLSHLFHLLHLF